MDYVELFYSHMSGVCSEEEREITRKTIEYLLDCKIEAEDIMKILEEAAINKSKIGVEDLPDWLWENSLIKKDTFYYHNTLHLKSKAPIFDVKNKIIIKSEFYLEMIIKYSMKDLMDYYYDKLEKDIIFRDDRKDAGAFKYLLNKYKALENMESLDFVLMLIDYESNEDRYYKKDILNLKENEEKVYEIMKHKCCQAELSSLNKIVWR